MHPSVLDYVQRQVQALDLDKGRVLEVGSRNINGTPRPYFKHAEMYVGLDMIDGLDVDVVAVANRIPYRRSFFNTVVCTEMLEHDPQPWETLPEIARVLRKGGHLLLTARGIGFDLHGFPDDYWRFTESGIARLAEHAGLTGIEVEPDPQDPGVFLVARKP